jgi:hypothetical protein
MFNPATDLVRVNGDTWISVIALVSVLGEAKAQYASMAAQAGTKDAAAVALAATVVMDDLRATLMKLTA